MMITLLSLPFLIPAGISTLLNIGSFLLGVQLALASIAPGFLSGFFAFTSRLRYPQGY